MLASGLGRTDYVRALLDAARIATNHPKHKIAAALFAAWTFNGNASSFSSAADRGLRNFA